MNIANQLSILRVLLVPVFVICLVYATPDHFYFHKIAVVVFLFACATDALDGYLARLLNQRTTLGTYIDPIADKLLLISGFLTLSFMTHLPMTMRIPAWVTITVIARDVVIVIGSTIIVFMTGSLKPHPLFVSKVTTLFQMTTLFFALISAPAPAQYGLYIATTVLTAVSGIEYIRVGGRLLQSV